MTHPNISEKRHTQDSSSLRRLAVLLRCCVAVATVAATVAAVCGCSTTKCIPDDDQLFVGLTKISYDAEERGDHFRRTQEELEAALATQPNAALFGSSYYRSPFPIGLWVWNALDSTETAAGKWVKNAFGKPPVLMSRVGTDLRASVASEVLHKNGYFRGSVTGETVTQSNPKKAKVSYRVHFDKLYRIDTLSYVGFPEEADSLIRVTLPQAAIHAGDPFAVSALDAERTRVTNLFRNNGYYYYQPEYASYLADTLKTPGLVDMRLQMASDIPEVAQRKWYVGRIHMNLRKSFREELKDSMIRRRLTLHYNGRRSPIRGRVVMNYMKLRPGRLYSYDDYAQSLSKLASTGLFSMVDFQFAPRDTTASCDTLDLTLNCVFDRPYDFYIEANAVGKTSGAFGPGGAIGFTKRNAFRGGEKFNLSATGTFEWQTGHSEEATSSRMHSYTYGFETSLELPRLLLPFNVRRRWFVPPTTLLKASSQVVNRRKYYKRHIVSGELTYRFYPSATYMHEFSPIILQYEYMQRRTARFLEILDENPYLRQSMSDQLVPKMRYTFTYTSPQSYRNPILWQAIVSEASNLLSLGYMVGGRKWNERDKTMFKNPYAQFLKLETRWRKTWQAGEHSRLVSYAEMGAIWSYGNAKTAPWSEQFYVGGANSIRAFNVRSIGPGAYHTDNKRNSYMDQTGDFKIQANLEYRSQLAGNLHGAIFLDAGNVWTLRHDEDRKDSKLEFGKLFQQMALGTGVGLRYDLDFFVLRLDWGFALHEPYKNGFYNVSKFKDAQCLHFAIGYPF